MLFPFYFVFFALRCRFATTGPTTITKRTDSHHPFLLNTAIDLQEKRT